MSLLPPVIPSQRGPLSLAGRLRLAVEILGAYAHVRWKLSRADITTTVRGLRQVDRRNGAIGQDARQLGLRLGRATARTLGPLPGDSRCLMQSLVLSRLLSRRGIDSKLVLAVRPGEDFAAHAWVEHHGQPLLEPAGYRFGRLVEI